MTATEPRVGPILAPEGGRALFVVGDVFRALAAIPDGSVDLVMCSPPFLALRSYLPAGHPDKALEIGSEPDPASFLSTLLALTAEWRRVLAPHGSICIELGDTYAGSGGAGGDYGEGGMRQGQNGFTGSAARSRHEQPRQWSGGAGWPLPKCLALIPEMYRVALAYGRNPLTGELSPAGRWRVRNVVRWHRPNPPVGALGDKFRPSTSDMVVACVSDRRFFDLDAVRLASPRVDNKRTSTSTAYQAPGQPERKTRASAEGGERLHSNVAGAPPLDTWVIPTTPYKGTTSTSRRVPCGPLDGGERTTSPDCPVHGDRPALPPTAPHDGHAGTESTHTPRTGDRLDLEQHPGCEATDETPDRSGSSPPPTSGSSAPECGPAAKPRSKASSRTGPSPATSPPGTPSEGTSGRTAGTSTPPSSGEHRPDTSASRTSADGSAGTRPARTSDRTAGSDTGPEPVEACSCSFHRVETQSTSHYAAYPTALCERPIKSMAPSKVCTVCGEPSRRIVGEATYERTDSDRVPARLAKSEGDRIAEGVNQHHTADGANTSVIRNAPTLGFTDCGHDAYRSGVVLDPFAGSGTTLAVATGHGHAAIGIDLDERNVALARDRVGPMFLDDLVLPRDEAGS